MPPIRSPICPVKKRALCSSPNRGTVRVLECICRDSIWRIQILMELHFPLGITPHPAPLDTLEAHCKYTLLLSYCYSLSCLLSYVVFIAFLVG